MDRKWNRMKTTLLGHNSINANEVPTGRFLAGIALVAMAGVGYQVALVRLLSVVLWYHFAFLVVSTAVLGFGLSGMAIVLRPSLAAARGIEKRLAGVAFGLAASIVFGYVTLGVVPFDPFRLGFDGDQLMWASLYVVAMMIPFFLSGLYVGIALVSNAERAGQLYAFDLFGAGLAAILTLGAFGWLGGPATLLMYAVVAALAGIVLVRSKGAWALFTCVALGAIALSMLLPLRITEDKVIGEVSIPQILKDSERTLETRWSAQSRIDVVQFDATRRNILIDGGVALTRLPPIKNHIDSYQPATDLGAVAFALVDEPEVLVLGSGGGWEVASALTHDAREITAVEINPVINQLVLGSQAEWVGDIFRDERVELVTAEARAFLSRTHRTWDVIISAHTISHSATTSGAMNLAESYTLTVEAFDAYLSRLSPGGALYIMRPESQLAKLAATAAHALRRDGLSPEARVAAFRYRPERPSEQAFIAGLIVVKDPAVLSDLGRLLEEHGGEALWLAPDNVRTDRYAAALDVANRFQLATDERPFFNFTRSWADVSLDDVRRVYGAGARGRVALDGEPVGEVSILVLLVLVFVFSALAIGVPMFLRRRELPAGRLQGMCVGGYFAALGVGYMYAELGLIHRLGLFLGSPTITFGVVVAGMLLSSGLGAALSQRIEIQSGARFLVLAAVTVSCVAVTSAMLVPWALGLSTMWRGVVALGFVVPVGGVLGFAFPLGMRLLDRLDPGYLPLAWGVNGFASVIGSATSIVVATSLGFTWLLVLAGCAYAMGWIFYILLIRRL